jgi:hypothetical protein
MLASLLTVPKTAVLLFLCPTKLHLWMPAILSMREEQRILERDVCCVEVANAVERSITVSKNNIARLC